MSYKLPFSWDLSHGNNEFCDRPRQAYRCMNLVLRILRPGAPFAFTVKLSEWDALGFGA
jgi:hypothetical protein